jgi:glycosyltransferase involved in cell wall biosynthesis
MLNTKKVLFLITKATWGGAQRYVYDLARSLPQNEFTPALLYGIEGRLSEILRNDAIRARQVPALARDIAIFSDISSFFQILSMLRSARPEILHLNSSKAAALGALAGRVAGVPHIVFTVHGWPFKERRFFLTRALIYLISWLTAVLSHHIIVVSEGDARIGRAMIGVGHALTHIPLGIAPLRLRPAHEAFAGIFGARSAPALAPQTLRLLSIAELTRNKGIRYAIEAVALLRERGIDAIYVVAGEGEERRALEELIAARGLGDRVFLPGYVPEASSHLRGFDALLVPSIKEGTPYALIEAGAAGMPVVVTDVIDSELMKRFHASARVPAQNPLALADAIESIGRTPHAIESGSRFPLDEMTQKTTDVYRLT